jgi:hypothetical protein
MIFNAIKSYNEKSLSLQKNLEELKLNQEKMILETEVEIKEQTFQFISREIHDNIIQTLSLAKLNLNILDYKNHSTIYHVKKTKNIKSVDLASVYNYYETFMNSISVFLNNIKYFNSIIEDTNKNVYIFGASYNTQLLLTIGLNINKINGILDNCKDKQNKYLYGYNLLINNPEITKENDCIVILHNGYYSNEIREQLKNINYNTEIIEFNKYYL